MLAADVKNILRLLPIPEVCSMEVWLTSNCCAKLSLDEYIAYYKV